ncbi:MAG: universal stress protein [Planctomycetota bacterium]
MSASSAPRRVLLATDGSPPAKRAGRFLARLPFPEKPALQLVRAIDLPVGPLTMSFDSEWPPLFRGIRDSMTTALKEEAATLSDGFSEVGAVVQHGHAAEETLAAAGRFGADLIACGAVGHSGIERALLGSVSDRIATHAACPVLVVRGTGKPAAGPDELAATGGDAGPPARPPRVLLTVDGSAAALAAVRFVSGFAWPAGTQMALVAVHLSDPPGFAAGDFSGAVPEYFPANASEVGRERAEAGLATAASIFTDRDFEVTTEVVEARHIGEAICKKAESADVDLAVVADRGHGLFTRFLMGSTSRFVLRHCKKSILVHRGAAG